MKKIGVKLSLKEIFAKDTQIAYMAILNAFGFKRLKIPAVAPTFFANIAKMLGIDVEFVDINLDMSSKEADVVSNFYETFTPKNKIVFQSFGKVVGDGEVWVMKYKDLVKIVVKDEKIAQEIEIFLDGGVKRGRLWNYDVVSFGIKNRILKPKDLDLEEMIIQSNKVAKIFKSHFKDSIYGDFLPMGDKTLKDGAVLLLKPSLYCPKEDIYAKLKERGVDVKVRFKPLYKTTLFNSNFLPVCEEFYKAVLILPLKEQILPVVDEVLKEYKYRGCRF
jgi:hypothetical protein